MVRLAHIFVAASILLSLVSPSLAVADPISFLYTVKVVNVAGPEGIPQEYRPPPFQVVATFDDQITFAFDGSDFRSEHYGRVGYSPLPDFLPVPSPYEGRPLLDPSFPIVPDSDNTAILGFEGGWVHSGRLGSSLTQPSLNFFGGSDYDRFILLTSSIRELPARPMLTPRSLAQLVGTPTGEPNFFFQVEKFDVNTGERIDAAFYEGFAKFRGKVNSPAPVPEPTSLLLFATGAGVIGQRAWKRRRRPLPDEEERRRID